MKSQIIIAKIAEKIRNELQIDSNQLLDLEDLLDKLNIQLVEDETLKFEGKIERNDSSTVITIGKHTNLGRKRFTIAHELGHYFLHLKQQEDTFTDSVFYRNLEYNAEEWEANEFAASLLMPETQFKDFADESYNEETGEYNLIKISQHFEVSRLAAYNRGRILNVFK